MSEGTTTGLARRFKDMSPKSRQYAMLGAIGVVFFGLVLGGVELWDRQPSGLAQPPAKTQPTQKNIVAPGSQVDPRDVWMAQSSQQMKEMDGVINGLKQRLGEVEHRQTGATAPAKRGQAESILPPLPPFPAATSPSPPISPSRNPIPPPIKIGATESLPPLPAAPPTPKDPGIAAFEVSDPPVAQGAQNAAGEQHKTYIPSGSFMRVVLLGGLDAPTGGQAQSNPWPVVMRVHDNAFLPNRYRAKVKECFVLGSGHGDISSERAYLRLESLSCVMTNGEVVDTNVKGYVVGEDGKAGMRGRLVSKQGQILANALMTGVISGIGQGLTQNATTYSTSALGTVGTVDSGKAFQAGIGTGIGKALDRLSQYYITLAEKTFPIIEIDAGRVVDIVLTKGTTLGMEQGGWSDDTYTDIWQRGRRLMKRSLNPWE